MLWTSNERSSRSFVHLGFASDMVACPSVASVQWIPEQLTSLAPLLLPRS